MAIFCECISSVSAAEDINCIEFAWPGTIPRAGQFFLVKPQRTGVFLGRPISVAGWKPQPANGSTAFGILRFLVAKKGRGSRELCDLKPGEKAELTGPLGNYWAQAGNLAQTESPIALVAGGIGIAPLLALAQEFAHGRAHELGKRPFDFYAGFRTGSFCLEDIKPRSLIIATEDGSLGKKGLITDFFNPTEYSRVFACGPQPMLKALAEICKTSGTPCFISVEKHMACGVGACKGCTVKTTGGNRCCCTDGPVFNAAEIDFDD